MSAFADQFILQEFQKKVKDFFKNFRVFSELSEGNGAKLYSS